MNSLDKVNDFLTKGENSNKRIVIFVVLVIVVAFVSIGLALSPKKNENGTINSEIETERFHKYNGAYLSEKDMVRVSSTNELEYIQSPELNTNIEYKYEYDNNPNVPRMANVRYEGELSSLPFYGKMDFNYKNDDSDQIKSIFIYNNYNNFEYNYELDYTYDDNNQLIRFDQTILSDGNHIFTTCYIAYYKEYVVEECENESTATLGAKTIVRNIYIKNELKDDEKTIWNLYQISPTYLYDSNYYNINNNVAIINIHSTQSQYYLGKEIYSSKKEYKGYGTNEVSSLITKRYFDKEGRVIKTLLIGYASVETYYMYNSDVVKSITYDNLTGRRYRESILTFGNDGYVEERKQISKNDYMEKLTTYDDYFNRNVKEDPVDEILENLTGIYNGTYNKVYYNEPKVEMEYYDYEYDSVGYSDDGISYMDFTLSEVNNYRVLLNNNDITSSCDEDNDDVRKVRCYINKDYMTISDNNKLDFYVSNGQYKDVLFTFTIKYSAQELDFTIENKNDDSLFHEDKITIEFYNYGKSLKTNALYLRMKAPKGPVEYTITMDDKKVTKKIESDGYLHDLDLSDFEDMKYDKSGSHIVLITLKDRYNRTKTKQYEFIYK